MSEQKKGGRMGRPPKHTETYKRTTIELPLRLLEALALKPNRTEWVVAAIEEKLQREQDQAAFFATLHK
jgi:hypothetical protein